MNKQFSLLTSDIIHNNLINLNQLTFEVTDACNLKCKYCGYGEFYGHYDKRNDKYMDMNHAFTILKYLEKLWSSNYSSSHKKETYISFYGGEPLMNMPFIKEVVSWIKKREIPHCQFIFTMTTNAVLLDKYIDYLAEHNFRILISLDGNEYHHSYRVDHANRNSFPRVYKNIKYIQEKYPDYFEKAITFNTVLHNRNNIQEIVDFFKTEFNKTPHISELNPIGIIPERLEEFSLLYNNRQQNLNQSPDRDLLKETLFMDDPQTDELCTYLHWHSGNVYKSYNELLGNEKLRKWIPTGTCLPFGKKMFITTNGKILACERIGHEYGLGQIEGDKVILDLEQVTEKYNEWYKKYIPQCSVCYNVHTCKQCLFYNRNLQTTGQCEYFMNKQEFEIYTEKQYQYLAKHPHLYRKIMEEVIIH